MADAVTSTTISDGTHRAVIQLTNLSDGTGESAVTKIDVSALTTNPVTKMAYDSVSIEKIWFSNIGMGVKIYFDASTDVLVIQLPADWTDELDFSEFSGIPDNAGSGTTGDIQFTTVGHSSGDSYTIVMKVIKHNNELH